MKGHLVVDGNQLCHQLHCSDSKWPWKVNLVWVYGGQYPEYRAAVEKFFQYLKLAGITPIVVFDGFLHMKEKFETLYNRYEDRATDKHKALLQMAHSQLCGGASRILPPMAYQVFHATLLELGVQQIIADGEGDVMVIRVANEYNCPVLSKDSDFFMARLPKGYIPLDRFNKRLFGNPTIKAEVFHLSEFYRQFGLQAGSDLHLAIPAVMGNDYLKKMVLEHISLDRVSNKKRFMNLIEHLKQCKSFEAFLASIPPASDQDTPEKHAQSSNMHEKRAEVDTHKHHPNSEDKQEKTNSTVMQQNDSDDTKEKSGNSEERSEGEASSEKPQAKQGEDTQAIGGGIHQQLRSNYQQAVEMYNNADMCKSKVRVADYDIPQWLAEKYYCGKLNSCYLLQAWLLGYLLPQSSETSKLLRQYAYSILGVGAKLVCEYPVISGTVSEVRVEAVHSIQGSPPQRLPRISEVEGLSPACRKQLLYQMLACDQDKIESLEEQWKLVIASVVFWARETQPNQALVKALLVCFLLCPTSKWLRLEDHGADSWLETQSAFIAWQCTYLDSIGLNELLMEPLQSPSAAFLFDGKLAMGLAAEPNVDDRVTEFGLNHNLYQSLLNAVMSQSSDRPRPQPTEKPKNTVVQQRKKVTLVPYTSSQGAATTARDTKSHKEKQPSDRQSERESTVQEQKYPAPQPHSCRAGREPHRAGHEAYSRRAGPELHSRRAGPEPHSHRAGPEPHSRRAGPEPHSHRAGPEPHSRRAGPEPHSHRAGPEPHSCRAGPEPHSRRAGPEPHSRRAGPEPHSHRAGPEPHSPRAGREPQTARGKIQSKPGKQKQKSESQTKTVNRFGLLPDDCDD